MEKPSDTVLISQGSLEIFETFRSSLEMEVRAMLYATTGSISVVVEDSKGDCIKIQCMKRARKNGGADFSEMMLTMTIGPLSIGSQTNVDIPRSLAMKLLNENRSPQDLLVKLCVLPDSIRPPIGFWEYTETPLAGGKTRTLLVGHHFAEYNDLKKHKLELKT